MEISKIQVFKRKIYNGFYKHLLYLFSIGLPDFFINKQKILSLKKNYSGPKLDDIIQDKGLLNNLNDQLKHNKYVVLGIIDEEGHIVSEFDLRLNKKVKKRTSFPREKFLIQLVALNNNCIGIKKNHSSFPIFFRELFAMTTLGKTDINIPVVLEYSVKKKYIIMEYIDGTTLREMIEHTEAKKKIKKLSQTEEFMEGDLIKKIHLITKIEKPYIHREIKGKLLNKISHDFQLMTNFHFVYQDIRYPNIVIFKNKIYWLDFEHCYYHPFVPESIFRIISAQNKRKFKQFFDI